MEDRTSRSSHKNRIVEGNNGTFETVLRKLSRERTTASPVILVATESLVTSLVHGSSFLNAFQLAQGYSPSILGIPSDSVPEELIQAHIYMNAIV